MQWITADDDNGNVNDGTPHMTAIFNAFNRHGIACTTPAATNSGCAAGPSTAPTLTVTPGNFQNQLSWNAVAGATRYWVMRSDGHAGCNFGKTRIADVTGTSFTDTTVANGRSYSYNVVAAGLEHVLLQPGLELRHGDADLEPGLLARLQPVEPLGRSRGRTELDLHRDLDRRLRERRRPRLRRACRPASPAATCPIRSRRPPTAPSTAR